MGGDRGCSPCSWYGRNGLTCDAAAVWVPGTGTVGLTYRFRRVKCRRPATACSADQFRLRLVFPRRRFRSVSPCASDQDTITQTTAAAVGARHARRRQSLRRRQITRVHTRPTWFAFCAIALTCVCPPCNVAPANRIAAFAVIATAGYRIIILLLLFLLLQFLSSSLYYYHSLACSYSVTDNECLIIITYNALHC